ncbi:MAG: hypothetical protein ACLTSL_01285 [Odoribacter splanchnicus]
MENRQNIILTRQQQEWQKALMQKSEDELREMLNEEDVYDAAFLRFVREELTGRVAGLRRRKTAGEIRKEEEEQQRQEEEQRQREEEERQRLAAERAAEAARREVENRRLMKKVLIIGITVLVTGGVCGYIIWNNTVQRLIERGEVKYENGEKEEGKNLLMRAFKRDKTGRAAVSLCDIYHREDSLGMEVYYCQQAADAGWGEYAFRYGLYLEEKGADGISYLKKGYDAVDDAEYALEVGRAAYFLGNAAYRNGRTDEAKRYWQKSSEMGCGAGRLAFGDWLLCHGQLRNGYREALACYEDISEDLPGLDDRIRILRDLVRYSGWSAWSYNNGDVLRAEDINGFEGKKIKRGVYSRKEGERFYGKFDAQGYGINAPGIITYKYSNGAYAIYIGDFRFVNRRWIRHGKGTYVEMDRTSRTGKWVNDQPAGEMTVIRAAGKPWE